MASVLFVRTILDFRGRIQDSELSAMRQSAPFDARSHPLHLTSPCRPYSNSVDYSNIRSLQASGQVNAAECAVLVCHHTVIALKPSLHPAQCSERERPSAMLQKYAVHRQPVLLIQSSKVVPHMHRGQQQLEV